MEHDQRLNSILIH